MSLKDTRFELNRELSMRKTKYPAWIQSGLLNKERAEKQITRLEDAITVLNTMTEAEYKVFLERAKKGTQAIFQTSLF
jgi:tryptophan 2,3-dioxygenase